MNKLHLKFSQLQKDDELMIIMTFMMTITMTFMMMMKMKMMIYDDDDVMM